MTTVQFLQSKRDEILKIAKRHGVTALWVFGSVARGEAVESSDFDFLVEVGPERSPWFPGGLIVDLESLLGRKVQVVTKRGLNKFLRDRVLSEAMPI
jgi:uncharacterized protein